MTKHKEIKDKEHIYNLIKNFNLLRIAEKLEIRKTVSIVDLKENKTTDDLDIKNQFSLSSKKKMLNKDYIEDIHKKASTININNDIINLNKKQIEYENINSNNYIKLNNNNNSNNVDSQHKNISNISNINNNNISNISNNSSNKQIEFTDYDAKCKKHNLPINSYVIGTNILYCSMCHSESNMSVYPLPRVVKDMKKKIDSSRLLINLSNLEINRLKEFFISYQEEFEKSNKQKIDEVFGFLYKLISYIYNTATQIYNQCKAEQKTQIDQRCLELDELRKELEDIDLALNEIYYANEGDYIKYEQNVVDIYDRLNNFLNYETELNLLSMKVGIKNDIKNSIFQILQDFYYIDVEFASIQGDTPTVKHILQKKKYWFCICGEMNNLIEEISCSACSAFRRFETIDNFYSDPEKVKEEDLRLIVLRKKTEAKVFQELLKETDNLLKSGENFYAIDIEWFYLWKSYITNDLSEKPLSNNKKRISINKNIGKY